VRGRTRRSRGDAKEIEVHTLTPSPALPRKREREQTEFVARIDFHFTHALLTPRL
jgi:hypothetical protein